MIRKVLIRKKAVKNINKIQFYRARVIKNYESSQAKHPLHFIEDGQCHLLIEQGIDSKLYNRKLSTDRYTSKSFK